MGWLRHLGGVLGDVDSKLSGLGVLLALSCDMLAARWRPRAPR